MPFGMIGALVGLSLALTGSGGALLAIPLFMAVLGFTLKMGTFYSLIVVVMASLIGIFANYKDVNVKYAVLMLSLIHI